MKAEFFIAFLGLVVIALLYSIASFLAYTPMAIFLSLFLLILGTGMIFMGFWGADYAFSLALKELDQSKQRGKIKGEKNKVFVPFMRDYTPTEWWNLNWFITALGAVLLGLGMFMLGILL